MLLFFTPSPCILGELSIFTAGSGRAGAGDVERLTEADELKELLLEARTGGFIGNEKDVGVPGVEGAGDGAIAEEVGGRSELRTPNSGGAGLFDDIRRRGGRSILETLLCWLRENWPSFDFNVYMCTDLSELWVATNSFSGSHATP